MNKIHLGAKVAFEKTLRDKVNWIANDCWGKNLRSHIEDLNKIIDAGTKLGVAGNCRQLAEKELAEIVAITTPLKILEMREDIKEVLIDALDGAGIDHNIFSK